MDKKKKLLRSITISSDEELYEKSKKQENIMKKNKRRAKTNELDDFIVLSDK